MSDPCAVEPAPRGDGGSAARPFRREEALISLLLAIGIGLCFWSGTGFEWSRILWGGYSRFFAGISLYLFALTRVAWLPRLRWRPSAPAGHRLLGLVGGPADPSQLFRTDLEFLRGLAWMLVTVTVYTNVKVRIPFFNATVGDDLFQALDHALIGERLVPALERYVAASPWLADALTQVYFSGYIWMVVLLLWFWIRGDAPRLRWLCASFCVLYLSVIFVTVLYPSYGPFFLDWERFRWVSTTMTGQTQAFLVARFLEAGELVRQGRDFIPVAFSGIAAFPSLHVGQMVLVAVVAWPTARPFAVFMVGVAVVTTVATLAFGWHYLVDALAGAGMAIGVPLALRRWSLGRMVIAKVASK